MGFKFSRNNLPHGLFINNEYVQALNKKRITVYNPCDGVLISDDVQIARDADVDRAVAVAEAAFPAWKKMTASARRGIMLRFADLLEKNMQPIAELSRITMGAPYEAFGTIEVGTGVEQFRYYAGWIDKLSGDSFPQEHDGFLKIVRNEPLGVTAGILPWNGPTGNFGMKAAPALATGNCIIIKSSEKAPLGILALGQLIIEAGFPPGVVQLLSGDGVTGALLAKHMRIRKVSFTGSIATGKNVQEMAAKSNLKRVTLELGGKSPAVVFDDCKLDSAVEWCANMITANSGQLCIAASRVYVQETIFERFLEKYKAAISAKRVGDPENKESQMGPLADTAQYERVTRFIEEGKKEATLAIGGRRIGSTGFFVEPTAFTDVPLDSRLHTDEIFGPVSVLYSFKKEDEVLRLCNNTHYGLMAGVFTQDINRAMRLAQDLESGVVGINCISLFFPTAPFGGSKESGIGRECGIDALKAYTEPKTVMVNLA